MTPVLSMGKRYGVLEGKDNESIQSGSHNRLPSWFPITGYPKKITVHATNFRSRKVAHKRLPSCVPIDDYLTQFPADFP